MPPPSDIGTKARDVAEPDTANVESDGIVGPPMKKSMCTKTVLGQLMFRFGQLTIAASAEAAINTTGANTEERAARDPARTM